MDSSERHLPTTYDATEFEGRLTRLRRLVGDQPETGEARTLAHEILDASETLLSGRTGDAGRLAPGDVVVVTSSTSWENDQRPLAACLKAWARQLDLTRDRAASELRVPRKTYDGWCSGRGAGQEGLVRRMMDVVAQLKGF